MKNRQIVRALCAMLCAVMLCSSVVSALGEAAVSVLQLPEKLTTIRREAFADTDSIECVIVPDGTERIESRAFADSGLREITLPSTLTYIADDAFEGCDDVTVNVPWGSYAHKWASFADVECVILNEGKDDTDVPLQVYEISSLKVITETDDAGKESAFVCVDATASENCILQVKVIEGTDVKTVLSEDITGGTASGQVKIAAEGVLPEYYALEAALTDAEGNVLSNILRDISHTQAYISADGKTEADYPEERVISFGDTGYAVLEDNVRVLSGEATEVAEGVYTMAAVAARADGDGSLPKVGDVLMMNVGGVQTPVKVGGISILDGGVIRIEADTTITLSEIYSKLDVGGYLQTDGDTSEAGANALFNYKKPFTKGALTVDIDVSLSAQLSMLYDKELLGEDYFEMSLDIGTWGNGIATLTGAFSTDDLEQPLEVEIFKKMVPIPYLPVPAQLAVTLPLDVDADAEGTFEVYFDKNIGFTWDTVNGYVKNDPPWTNYADARLEADFVAKTGPRISFGFDLEGLVEAWLYGQGGVKITGHLMAQQHFGTPAIPDEDKVHACNLCVDMDACLFGSFGAHVGYNITEEVNGSKTFEFLYIESEKFLDLYGSLINESASVHKGEKVFGLGECPNSKYRIDFAAEDMDGNTVEKIRVDVTDGDMQDFYGYTPYSLYMYKGSYTAGAEFEIGIAEEEFDVIDHADKVTVKENAMTISGKATEGETGKAMSGVTVTLTMPNGRERSKTTDKKGAYDFGKLPAGKYSLVFEADGYSDYIVDEKEYPAGEKHIVNAVMNEQLPYLFARLQYPFGGEYQTAYAKQIGGYEAPWEIALIPGTEGDWGLDTFYLKYSEDKPKYKFTRGYDEPFWLTMELKAADMGDGKYTYSVIFYTELYNWCIIYREDGDTLVPVLDFSYTGMTDSVYGPDLENDGYVDYNNAKPSAGPGGIRETYGNFVENDVGTYDLKLLVEEADYSSGSAASPMDVVTFYRLIDGELVIVDQYID